MLNSLERLFAEMIAALGLAEQHVSDPYARTQLFAAIDLLTNLAGRVEWKRADVQGTIEGLRSAFDTIAAVLDKNDAHGCELHALCRRARAEQWPDAPARERDRLNGLLILAMREATATRAQLGPAVADAIMRATDAYLRQALEAELSRVRRPLFRRMSQA